MDLIDRNEAIDAVGESIADGKGWYSALVNVPSAQPTIIRCKDCKHYQFADNRAFGMPVKMCEWFGFEDVDDDDFCSRTEMRTDE